MIEESKLQLLVAERYLHVLRMAYPEVMASIRTKQVAQEMLLVKEAYVHELKASGDSVSPHQVCHALCSISKLSACLCAELPLLALDSYAKLQAMFVTGEWQAEREMIDS